MSDSSLFSRTATTTIGALLLAAIAWAAWMLGPTAVQRWFG